MEKKVIFSVLKEDDCFEAILVSGLTSAYVGYGNTPVEAIQQLCERLEEAGITLED